MAIQKDLELIRTFSKTITGVMENIYRLQDEIKSLLINYCDEVDKIIFCAHEILINAIEHGNELDSKKNIKIEVSITEKYIEIVVADQGGDLTGRIFFIKKKY